MSTPAQRQAYRVEVRMQELFEAREIEGQDWPFYDDEIRAQAQRELGIPDEPYMPLDRLHEGGSAAAVGVSRTLEAATAADQDRHCQALPPRPGTHQRPVCGLRRGGDGGTALDAGAPERRQRMSFDPQKHLIQLPKRIKDKTGKWVTIQEDYLEVKWRLCWFRDRYPHGRIVTEEVYVDLDRVVSIETTAYVDGKRETTTKTGTGYARYRTTVEDGEGGEATGYGTENAAEFADFCERAETRSIGRALAGLGIGTQFIGQELTEMDHSVDGPAGHGTTEDGAAPEQTSSAQAAPERRTRQPKAAVDKPTEKLNHEEAYVACIQELTRLAGPSAVEQVAYLQEAFGTAIDSTPKMYQLGKTPLLNGLKRLREMSKEQPPEDPQGGEGASVTPAAASAPAEEDVPSHPPPQTTPEGAQAPKGDTIAAGPTQGEGGSSNDQPQCPVVSRTGVRCQLPAHDYGEHYFAPPRPEEAVVKLPDAPLVVPDAETGVRYVSISDAMMMRRWCDQHGQTSLFAAALANSPRNVHGNVMMTDRQWGAIKLAVQAIIDMNTGVEA